MTFFKKLLDRIVESRTRTAKWAIKNKIYWY